MVRWVWQNRLIAGLLRFLRLLLRWILIWLSFLARHAGRYLRVSGRMAQMLVRPRNPDNLFVVGSEADDEAAETPAMAEPQSQETGHQRTLLWAEEATSAPHPEWQTNSVSLWRGTRQSTADQAVAQSAVVNQRFAYLNLLAAQIKRLTPADIRELDALIQRLARKWLDVDESFEWVERRNKLDIGRTLRYNIPRYAGQVLHFRWAHKERPVPQLAKPAKILLIGDVSHSMVHYVSVLLYFFHKLTFRFTVDSYVFSNSATHATPFLNGLGTFEEKLARLVEGAKSWNAGTRFGSALQEIADHAQVDENTYVIIATDGKVSLQDDEGVKIERYMKALRGRARQIIFLTPAAEFSDGASGKIKPERLGSFKYDFYDIPIFQVGPPLWYGTLGQYANRLYLVRTVQDLIDVTEDLIAAEQ